MRRSWFDRTWLVAGCLFACALLVRLLYLLDSASNPTFGAPVVDSETYDGLARAFAAHGALSDQFFWQPFFYPMFLSVVYAIGGPSISLAKVLQACIGSATCVLTMRLGEVVFDRRSGLLAGGIVALYGPLVFFDGELLSTGWASFWSLVLILLCLGIARSGGLGSWLALGVCGALSVLTRPTFLPFLAVASGWLLVSARRRGIERRRVLVGFALGLVGFSAIAVPVALASREHTGRTSILPASGGLNLHIGNNPDAARTISIRPGWDWKELTNLPRFHGVERKRDTGRFFRGLVLEYVRTDPGGFARGLLSKCAQFFCTRELPRNIDVYVFRDWSTLLRASVWKVDGFGFPFGILLPLGLAGVVLRFRRIPVPLGAFLVAYPLAVVLVFVSARYRAPVIPALAVVAAGGWFALVAAVAERRWMRVAVALGVGLSGLLAGTALGPFPQESVNTRAELDYFLGTRAMNAGDLDAAVERLRHATELVPAHGDAHNHLGLTYARLGNWKLALRHFELSVESNPRSVTARTNLARVLAASGRTREAVEQFRIAVAQDPFDLDLRYHFGETLLKLGLKAEAAEHLRLVVAARPDDERARKALSQTHP